ncbi:MAG: hypothetical protein EA378_00730 [Phycisphaerales bacterium]|nr:MAG: hypothetical protein EA378_00730 [Phycisphaerales bacterium]
MNWLVFAIAAWFVLGLEVGLKDIFQLGPTAIAPSFVVPLAVFIALAAPPRQTLWACLILGLGMDLTARVAGSPSVVVGPYALGFLLMGQLVLAARGLMIRRNPLSLVLLSVLGSIVASIVVVAIYTIRGLVFGPEPFPAGQQLVTRVLAALYTVLTAFGMSLLLLPAAGLFGFPHDQHRRFSVART